MKKKDKAAYKAVCHSIREDGAYVEAGENDNLIVQKLEADPDAFGVFGFSFLDQNLDRLQGSMVDGVAPEFEDIASGDYPVSRSLYFYVKKAHMGQIPGIEGYLAEFTSDRAWGDDGYLTDKGLIPMPEEERMQFAADVKNLTSLKLGDGMTGRTRTAGAGRGQGHFTLLGGRRVTGPSPLSPREKSRGVRGGVEESPASGPVLGLPSPQTPLPGERGFENGVRVGFPVPHPARPNAPENPL